MKTKTSFIANSLNRSSLWRCGFLLIPLVLALSLALSPQARAVCQDGCLENANTVQGENALFNLTTAFGNTATGWEALFSNTVGGFNTATGGLALASNTTGILNTATGYAALAENTTGINNTATGVQALNFNTIGSNNSAHGSAALYSNTIGSGNTANGWAALYANRSGINNTANGFDALAANRVGNYNTADGQGSLSANGNGSNNTAVGQNALHSNMTGSMNIAVGSNAGFNLTTGNNNIDIFDRGVAGEANTIRIGTEGTQTTTFVAGISGATVTGTAVVVNSSGQLGVAPSSQRFKQNIQTMGEASDILLALRPVTFKYKPDVDPKGIPQFGLVAEEVEKVNPALVVRDAKGKVYTVRYEAINAMLLNEFLKEHRKNEQQEATIARQQQQIEALTAGLQRVSAQVEMSRPASQVVNNNQ